MKSLLTLCAIAVTSLGLVVAGMDVAEAKRMGGGKSFGGKFSQSQSVKRDNNMSRQSAAPSGAMSAAQTKNSGLKQQMASKGGMMGLLGGLAIGGLLGALFFGGAFENFNFFDFIMIALLIFVAFKIFKAMARKGAAQQPAPAGGPAWEQNNQQRENAEGVFGGGNQQADNNPKPAFEQADFQASGDGLDALRGEIDKDFDQQDFLDGAKSCFAMLQKAWDDGDLADIRQFTTDHAFAEIQEQFQAREGQSTTEILDLEAELLNLTRLDSKSEATVLFNAHLKENGAEGKVSEVWHFVRAKNSTQQGWQLEGIQQVED